MTKPDKIKIAKEFEKILSNAEINGVQYWKNHEVRKGYRFYLGVDQWEPAILERLANKGLNPITLNRIPPFINSVQGELTRLSGETKYFPTDGVEAGEYSEMANEFGRWGKSQANSESMDKTVLKDAEICGLGVKEQYLDFIDNPDGSPRERRVAPIECIPDFDAPSGNFNQGEYFIRARFFNKKQFKDMFPDVPQDSEDGGLDLNFLFVDSKEREFDSNFRLRNNSNATRLNEIMVFDYQFKVQESFKRVENPLKEEFQAINPFRIEIIMEALVELKLSPEEDMWSVSSEQYAKLNEVFTFDLVAQDAKRNKYWRAWISQGKVIKLTPAPFKHGFSYKVVTCFWDDEKRCPYGFVRALIDPQKVANASFMHIFEHKLSAPKPSVMYEDGAVDDEAVFENGIARNDATIRLEQGGLGKIQTLDRGSIPSGFEEPLHIAVNAFPEVTGINFQFTGLDNSEIPASLDRQRNEKSSTTLADIIDNYRLYLKQCAIGMLEMGAQLTEAVPNRMLTVVGKNGVDRLKLLTDVFRINYDVFIDQSQESVNQRQENFKLMLDFIKAGVLPPDVAEVLAFKVFENAPIQQSIIQETIEEVARQRQAQAQASQQVDPVQQGIQEQILADLQATVANKIKDLEKKQSEIAKNQASSAKTFAEAQQTNLENEVIAISQPMIENINLSI